MEYPSQTGTSRITKLADRAITTNSERITNTSSSAPERHNCSGVDSPVDAPELNVPNPGSYGGVGLPIVFEDRVDQFVSPLSIQLEALDEMCFPMESETFGPTHRCIVACDDLGDDPMGIKRAK